MFQPLANGLRAAGHANLRRQISQRVLQFFGQVVPAHVLWSAPCSSNTQRTAPVLAHRVARSRCRRCDRETAGQTGLPIPPNLVSAEGIFASITHWISVNNPDWRGNPVSENNAAARVLAYDGAERLSLQPGSIPGCVPAHRETAVIVRSARTCSPVAFPRRGLDGEYIGPRPPAN